MGGEYTSKMSVSSSLRLSNIIFYPISLKITVRFYKYFTGRLIKVIQCDLNDFI